LNVTRDLQIDNADRTNARSLALLRSTMRWIAKYATILWLLASVSQS
jgi:hypothetical protein